MFKVNLKNYIAIGILTVILLFLVVHFEDVCFEIAKFFRL